MKAHLNLSLKNKIVFSILVVILIISMAIAFLARWILVSSLTNELELRGNAIAHSVAEHGASFLLDKDYPRLLSLIFDEAKLREREHLISYIFVTDPKGTVLSHTFTRPFPDELLPVTQVPPEVQRNVAKLDIENEPVSDIAVPVNEGLYRIGTVHVGLSMDHIDALVAKLRITFLGFIAAIILILIAISTRLSRHITQPITKLTKISDELSRGNFDITLDLAGLDEGWDPSACPAFTNTDLPCWNFDDLSAFEESPESNPEKFRTCRKCKFYKKREGDEVVQLADSFRNMVWSIKLYRRRLSESEDKYRSLFNSGPDPIFVINRDDHVIVDANPRALEVYGYTQDELIGKSFDELDPDNTQEYLSVFNSPSLESSCVYRPKIIHYKNGKRPFFVNAHSCSTSYRGQAAIILAVNDVTEMVEKDAQLIQASKMKTLGEMSAGIAHELNQPLNAIKMGSEFLLLMKEQGLTVPPEHFQEVVHEISAQVDRAAEIIQTLRAFGRKANFFKERININDPVLGVLSVLRKQFELENITFDIDLGKNLPCIMAHDNRLQQVLFNLVTNARDAINEKSSTVDVRPKRLISLRTYAEGDKVVVAVGDTGVGIPDQVKDKIFEPFFTTKEIGRGMGLGLAISYGIIEDYSGHIKIDSKEDEGTTFTISFPAAA
ncbi:MAG: ATP-binding protein [Desulfovibrionaceae bacterium]|nr:ATP-binding protein [Desulfovibrionaceae bacterium]